MWIGPLSSVRATGLSERPGAVDSVKPAQKIDEIAAALGRPGADDQHAGGEIEDRRIIARLSAGPAMPSLRKS